MVGDAEPGFCQHGDVVGPVAHGQNLPVAQTEFGAVFAQQVGFGLCVDDAAVQTACQAAVVGVEQVGMGVVEAEAGLQAVGEKGEAARYQHEFHAVLFAFAQEVFRAGRQFQHLVVHFLQHAFRQSGQQADAFAQRLFEVQFAAHGLFGNRRHLFFQPDSGGNFVHAFYGNQCRIHVADNQSEVGERDGGQYGVVDFQLVQFGGGFGRQGEVFRHFKAQDAAVSVFRRPCRQRGEKGQVATPDVGTL